MLVAAPHGWMVLEVNSDGNAVMVRRDSAAICDLVFVPKREASHG